MHDIRLVGVLCAVTGVLSFAPTTFGAAYPPPTPPNTGYHGKRIATKPDEEPAPNQAVDYPGARMVLRVTTTSGPASEPTVGVNRRGVAFVAGAGFDGTIPIIGHSHLYRQMLSGEQWQQLDPGAVSQYAFDPGNDLDPYVYVEPDTGRVFFAPLAGAGTYLNWSDDEGATWSSSFISAVGVNDHQTLVAAAPRPGAGAPQPSDPKFPKVLYYCVNAVYSDPCSRSSDGGRTFVPVGDAYYGTEPTVPGCASALMGQLAADGEGRIFLPSGHCGYPELAVSEDNGITWTRSFVSTSITASDTHTGVAADRAGNLYYAWYDATYHHAFLATSTDHGRTWSKPLDVTPPGVHETNFPAVAAGDPGHVALTFPGTTADDRGDKFRPWDAYVVASSDALDTDPTFEASIFNDPRDPIHRGNCNGRCGGLFDFVKVIVSPHDGAFWAAVGDDCLEDNKCNATRNTETANTPDNELANVAQEIEGPWMAGAAAFVADHVPPVLRSVRARRRGGRVVISFRASEAATVRLTVKRHGRVVLRRRLAALRGSNKVTLRLRRGRYALRLEATDAAGNRARSRTATLRR
jgi:hypothetical protein